LTNIHPDEFLLELLVLLGQKPNQRKEQEAITLTGSSHSHKEKSQKYSMRQEP
jgi:hypothetical protein